MRSSLDKKGLLFTAIHMIVLDLKDASLLEDIVAFGKIMEGFRSRLGLVAHLVVVRLEVKLFF